MVGWCSSPGWQSGGRWGEQCRKLPPPACSDSQRPSSGWTSPGFSLPTEKKNPQGTLKPTQFLCITPFLNKLLKPVLKTTVFWFAHCVFIFVAEAKSQVIHIGRSKEIQENKIHLPSTNGCFSWVQHVWKVWFPSHKLALRIDSWMWHWGACSKDVMENKPGHKSIYWSSTHGHLRKAQIMRCKEPAANLLMGATSASQEPK